MEFGRSGPFADTLEGVSTWIFPGMVSFPTFNSGTPFYVNRGERVNTISIFCPVLFRIARRSKYRELPPYNAGARSRLWVGRASLRARRPKEHRSMITLIRKFSPRQSSKVWAPALGEVLAWD